VIEVIVRDGHMRRDPRFVTRVQRFTATRRRPGQGWGPFGVTRRVEVTVIGTQERIQDSMWEITAVVGDAFLEERRTLSRQSPRSARELAGLLRAPSCQDRSWSESPNPHGATHPE
jgi:hypothetical protein